MLDVSQLLNLFPVQLPEVPHRYEGRIDGMNRLVSGVTVAPHPENPGLLVITVDYPPVGDGASGGLQDRVEIITTYHIASGVPEEMTVNGKTVSQDQVHFKKGWSFHGGPWIGFSFGWIEAGLHPHRADVRAFIGG